MASTAADIIASAKTEAEAARQSALSSLSGLSSNLETGYNTQTQSTKDYYTNMLNNLQNAYNTNAKSAYGTYQSDMSLLNNNLARLGLQNSGYGVSQQLLAGSSYSKNLATLQSALQTNQANLGVEQSKQLADLYNTYLNNLNSLEQYKYEAGQKAYDTAYGNAYQAQQDAIANDLAERQLALQQASLYASSRGGGSSSGGSYYDEEIPDAKFKTEYFEGDIPQATLSDAGTYGTTSNRYQPKGISGHGTLQKSGDKITFNTQTLSGKKQTVKQNIWVAEDGTKWYWEGRDMVYKQI